MFMKRVAIVLVSVIMVVGEIAYGNLNLMQEGKSVNASQMNSMVNTGSVVKIQSLKLPEIVEMYMIQKGAELFSGINANPQSYGFTEEEKMELYVGYPIAIMKCQPDTIRLITNKY